MNTSPSRSLGVLELEYGLPPHVLPRYPAGALLNPDTFAFPVISETVPGAWADTLIPGNADLESACIAAAQRLVERGAAAITADCGFFIRHQLAVAKAVPVPVALSSLLMVPTLIRQLPLSAKLAVVTADANHCGRDLLGVSDPAEQSRVVIGGIEGGNYWNGFMKRTLPSTDLATIETDFAACITRLVNAHPDIGAILFECTAIPFVAPAMRRLTNLPHYDITNLVQLMMAAIR